MKTLRFYIICFLCLASVSVLIVGCKKKETETNTEADVQKTIAELNALPKRPLTIKGLTMGMDKSEARNELNKLGFESVRTDYNARAVGSFTGSVTSDWVTKNAGGLLLVYNSDNKLVHVEMWGGMANYLFNVADLTVKEFAETFIKEYQIGEMEPFQRGSIAGWKYRDEENGVEFVIYTDSSGAKRITFHSVPKEIERKFN